MLSPSEEEFLMREISEKKFALNVLSQPARLLWIFGECIITVHTHNIAYDLQHGIELSRPEYATWGWDSREV